MSIGDAIRAACAAWLCLSLGAGSAYAATGGIAVIVATGDPRASSTVAELAGIYRRRLVVDPWGRTIVPVNLPAGNAVRTAFSVAVLGQTPEDLQAYWNQEYFQGVSPPETLDSGEAVLRFVSTTPGAIGYVLDCEVDARVKAIARIPVPDDPALTSSNCPPPATTANH